MQNSLRLRFSKAVFSLLVFTLFLCGCTPGVNVTRPDEKKYTAAVWFSYLDYQDLCYGKTEDDCRFAIETALDQMQSLGANTVYVHAVAFTDSFYDSGIYPRTKLLGDIDYDPLALFVEAAHSCRMHIEAWVNPLRSVKTEETDLLEGTVLEEWIRHNDERIRLVDGRYYLNPAYSEVRELVAAVVQEILDHYLVDGIHFDDYFYPDGADQRFDAYIYGETSLENNISREDFRREAVNQLVKEVHDTVRKKSSRLTFGISVAGNLENDLNIYYADPFAWIRENTIDYLIPQVYWGFDHPVKPYRETLMEWFQMAEGSQTQIYAGLAGYKIGTKDIYAGKADQEWVKNSDMLAKQITYAFEIGCQGAAIFRYGSLFLPDSSVSGNVEKEIINIKKLLNRIENLSQ